MNIGFWSCIILAILFVIIGVLFAIFKEKAAKFVSGFNSFSKAIYIPIFRFSLLRMCFPGYHTCRIIIFCFKACIFRLVTHT